VGIFVEVAGVQGVIDFAAGGVLAAVGTAFAASLVEVVEAFTILLAVAAVSGWRPAALGSGAGLAVLVGLVLLLGSLFAAVPIHLLQFVAGVLLLLFGMRWLRKAVLRSAGIIALSDEERAFAAETEQLERQAERRKNALHWIATLTAFKATILEGIEVVFVVIAVGGARGQLAAASLGAAAAFLLVLAIGLLVHKPLSRVPENRLKLGVGVMLSAFGVYWAGEGLGVAWPGEDLASIAFAALFLATGLGLAAILRASSAEPSP
jgi:Ca2+/H+ antiporter, TMEM165/GDT1 family